MVPSSRTALNTSPKPPVPMRLSFEKLLVAFVISLPVKILDDFPVEFALSISSRSLTMFLWISFLTFWWLCLVAITATAIASVTPTTATAAPSRAKKLKWSTIIWAFEYIFGFSVHPLYLRKQRSSSSFCSVSHGDIYHLIHEHRFRPRLVGSGKHFDLPNKRLQSTSVLQTGSLGNAHCNSSPVSGHFFPGGGTSLFGFSPTKLWYARHPPPLILIV
ncbi:unnamed protein product [Arabidopsis thaliana]|uniref:Transmembrane protein n=1 Tax=Arabidopsis thaliana TaxID=3702 RepID=A0A654FXH0_ARATH|nr:unnamed protein product [Arabidopsis thaliana]